MTKIELDILIRLLDKYIVAYPGNLEAIALVSKVVIRYNEVR